MDIRGIEITNQLRSAIRAKLLELGVKYDEELPDYILVMVVNKKSREQMNDDLSLFLEDSTSPFVDWLHDQVLKKLQRVTVAKKKSRELVPTSVVKQEEDRKKRKEAGEQADKLLDRPMKPEKKEESSVAELSENQVEKSDKVEEINISNQGSLISAASENILLNEEQLSDVKESTEVLEKPVGDTSLDSSRGVKRPSETANTDSTECNKDSKNSKRLKALGEPNDSDNSDKDNQERTLKSSINKPRITSVVSVKNRLGNISTRNKFSTQENTQSLDSRYISNKSRFDEQRMESYRGDRRRSDNSTQNKFEERTNSIRKKRELEKGNDMRSRLIKSREERFGKVSPIKNERTLVMDKQGVTLKSRLGSNIARPEKHISPKKQKINESRKFQKFSNVKSRLGSLNSSKSKELSNMRRSREDKHFFEDEDMDDDDEQSVINTPVKSHVVAVNPPKSQTEQNNEDDEVIEECKVPSKVIVTPRPLKPLQPKEKRATQSLLLRAVAEANQSVVRQKNPEPPLKDKDVLKSPLKPVKCRSLDEGPDDQNISIQLRTKKRYVMENIQVELTNSEVNNSPKSDSSEKVSDDHMGVVMSLFQRSDDNQKFLVTLNGYNNNILKERNSDDEEHLEMDVNDEEELELSTNTCEETVESDNPCEESLCDESSPNITIEENDTTAETSNKLEANQNQNLENFNLSDVYKESLSLTKKRKLSPIVYNRSRSSSPCSKKTPTVASNVVSLVVNKKTYPDSTLSTAFVTTAENCRYWPNCTLGSKCAYYHPEVLCSSFPACKFRNKCAYKHPKCKFGVSCTKIGCVFSHPPVQCKYHPFCMKIDCSYSHPSATTTVTLEPPSRAKFTWKKQD